MNSATAVQGYVNSRPRRRAWSGQIDAMDLAPTSSAYGKDGDGVLVFQEGDPAHREFVRCMTGGFSVARWDGCWVVQRQR